MAATATAPKITYTTKRGEHAHEYTATVGQYRIMLDKIAREYYPWSVFVVRFDGETYVDSDTRTMVLHTFTRTLAQARKEVADFIAAELSAPAVV